MRSLTNWSSRTPCDNFASNEKTVKPIDDWVKIAVPLRRRSRRVDPVYGMEISAPLSSDDTAVENFFHRWKARRTPAAVTTRMGSRCVGSCRRSVSLTIYESKNYLE